MARKTLFLLLLIAAILGGLVLMRFLDNRGAMAELREFAERIESAEAVFIHEGLPHPGFEHDLYQSELANAEYGAYDDFHFYKEPIKLDSKAAEELSERIIDVAMPYQGVKMCGEFHPDYMLEWKVAGESYRAHVCFNCRELRCVGPDTNLLLDSERSTFLEMEEQLWKYQSKRLYSTVSGVNDFWQDFYLADSASLHLGGKHVPNGVAKVPLIDGHFRSDEAETFSKEDKNMVAEVLIAKGAVLERTDKKCIFDPDYVISWHADGQFNFFLLCLTCGELQSGTVKFDLSPSVLNVLRQQLLPYARKLKNRPSPR